MTQHADHDARPRLPLSRERILQAAIEMVDEGGLDGLTMRKLGESLGFEAMSLYNHVANKDELLDGMLDLVLDEMGVPDPDGDWDKAVRASAVRVYQTLRRHTWAAGLLLSPGRLRPARLVYMDALLGRLRTGGFSAETTYHAYHVLDGYIFGFTLWQTTHDFSAAQVENMVELFTREITPEKYPWMHEHGKQHFDEGPHHDVSAFEFGLDLILDGLGRQL